MYKDGNLDYQLLMRFTIFNRNRFFKFVTGYLWNKVVAAHRAWHSPYMSYRIKHFQFQPNATAYLYIQHIFNTSYNVEFKDEEQRYFLHQFELFWYFEIACLSIVTMNAQLKVFQQVLLYQLSLKGNLLLQWFVEFCFWKVNWPCYCMHIQV